MNIFAYLTIRRLALAFASLVLMLPGREALSDEIFINNHSFETTPLNPGQSTSTIAGWTRFGPGSVLDPTETQFPGGNTTDGENILVLGGAPATVVSQNLTPTLAYGVYLLTFDVGNRLDQALPQIGLSLLADGTILNDDFKIIPTPGEGLFESAMAQWTVLPTNVNGAIGFGDNVRLRFLANGAGGSAVIDNVRLQFFAPVPEPATGFAAGALLLLTMTTRRSRPA